MSRPARGFVLQEGQDVVASDFQTNRLFERHRFRLVVRLLQHGGETENIAMLGLFDDHFLLILVHCAHSHLA